MASDAPRRLRTRVLTSAGWFSGRLLVPQGSTILQHLNRAPAHLRLADAVFEGHDGQLPFVAVRREEVRLVLPLEPDEDATVHADDRDIAGVLDAALVRGSVRMASQQRSSDFFGAAQEFVTFRGASLWLGTGPDADANQDGVLAHVRVPALVAFSEAEDVEDAQDA